MTEGPVSDSSEMTGARLVAAEDVAGALRTVDAQERAAVRAVTEDLL